MRAMVRSAPGTPLALANLPLPHPGPGQVLVRVRACGVCRTDLHVARGELPDPKLPLVLGHEIVGQIADLGPGVTGFALRAGRREPLRRGPVHGLQRERRLRRIRRG